MPSFAMVMWAKEPVPDPDDSSVSRRSDETVSSEQQSTTTSQVKPSRLIRSRRRRYLERHPSYFASASASLEHSDPLAYDRLIRQHQSAAEREAEGITRGFARTLEASLLRGEAKLASLRPDAQEPECLDQNDTKEPFKDSSQNTGAGVDWSIATITDMDDAQYANSEFAKAQAKARWDELITERFTRGLDDEFDYSSVDKDETLDADEGVSGTWAEREREEAWFDAEEPGAGDGTGNGGRRELFGETGVQDF